MRKLKELLCDKLKDYREKSGLTLEQVSIAINTTSATVSRWESGKYEPSLDTIEQLANLYGVNRDDFFLDEKQTISISEKKLQDTIDSMKEIVNAASLPNCPRDIFEGLAKFGPNDEKLWETVRRTIDVYLSLSEDEKGKKKTKRSA